MAGSEAAKTFIQDLPRLHHWAGQPQVGGLNRLIGKRLIEEVGVLEAPSILETGAGASTLLFLCLQPRSLIAIAPDAGLRDRVLDEARARSISSQPLQFIVDRSELALPRLCETGRTIDVALIDGNHGWPAVFVDFCYVNVMLPRGGLLFVDDVQLHSVGQLFLLLRHQPEYEFVALDGKFATFRKVSDEPFLPEWAGQPFITLSSLR